MPVYTYKATDQSGKLVTGTVISRSRRDIAGVLDERGLKLLASKESRGPIGHFALRGIPLKEKISLCRYLSLIINSGISLGEGLDLLSTGTINKTLRTVIQEVASSTRRGRPLHESFARYPQHFDTVFLTMIEAGETYGTLTESFSYLAHQYEQLKDLKQKVTSALLYPMIIIGLMGAVGVLMFTFVLPRLSSVFENMNITLPWYTRLLFTMSDFFQKNVIAVSVSIPLLAIVVIVAFMTKKGKQMSYFVLSYLPITKNLIMQYNLVRFSQSLALLLKSGVSVTKSVELAIATLSVAHVRSMSDTFQKKLTRGVQLSTVLEESRLFPALMVQLVRVGERTGNLEVTLADLATFYQSEVEYSLKNFVTILEPLIMLFVGVGVGIMVVSVISPMYSIIGQLQTGL